MVWDSKRRKNVMLWDYLRWYWMRWYDILWDGIICFEIRLYGMVKGSKKHPFMNFVFAISILIWPWKVEILVCSLHNYGGIVGDRDTNFEVLRPLEHRYLEFFLQHPVWDMLDCRDGMLWFGMVWDCMKYYGMAWDDMGWFEMEWYGMTWQAIMLDCMRTVWDGMWW